MYGRYMKAYRKTDVEAEISVANPHRVVQMLFEGLLDRLAQAKGAILRKDYGYKSERISKAIGIINGLQMSIDPSYDEEAGRRLIDLYEYMKERLNEASVNLDVAPIDEVISLVTPIKEAWDNIPEEERERVNEIIEKKQGKITKP